MYIHQAVDTSGHWHDGQVSLRCRLTAAHHGKCTHGPVLGQHVYSILKREDRASRYSPFACTLHAGYAKQVMHVSVPLPPEKANSDALVLGSWQMQHIHTSRQSARNYSKRCTLSSLMHPHGDAWASSVPSRTSIYVSPCHLGTWMHAWSAWHRSHTAIDRRVHALDPKAWVAA